MSHNLPVPQPAPYFGATRGKNKYGRWLAVLPLYAAVLVFTIVAYHTPNFLNDFDAERQVSVAGLALAATIIGGLILAFYTSYVFGRADELLREDAAAGRDQYAATSFREWLNARYGVNFSADAAIRLVRGGSAWVDRVNDEGRTERVRVYLDGIDPLANVIGVEDVIEVPDVSDLADQLTLMVVEEPAKPRVYAWR